MDSSAVFGFEVPIQTRGYNDRNFKSTALVSRFRSSHHYAARSLANFGIKGTLAIYDSSAVFGFEVPTQTRGYNDRNFKSTALALRLPSKEGAAQFRSGMRFSTPSRDSGTRHFTATLFRVGSRPCARYAAHDRRRNAGDERSLDESSFASLTICCASLAAAPCANSAE